MLGDRASARGALGGRSDGVGREVLGREDVMEGVPELRGRGSGRGDVPRRRKLVTLHEPIQAGSGAAAPGGYPGELVTAPGEIELNAARETRVVRVMNTGDRPIQVGSHFHFAQVNDALSFDRPSAEGFRLDMPAGTSARFEPGAERDVALVALGGIAVSPGAISGVCLPSAFECWWLVSFLATPFEIGFVENDREGASRCLRGAPPFAPPTALKARLPAIRHAGREGSVTDPSRAYGARSYGKCVSVSLPLSVTTRRSSKQTSPTPGVVMPGSRVITSPATSGLWPARPRSGSSWTARPTPWPSDARKPVSGSRRRPSAATRSRPPRPRPRPRRRSPSR